MPYVFRLTGVPHADEWEAAVGFRCGANPLQHAGSGYGIIICAYAVNGKDGAAVLVLCGGGGRVDDCPNASTGGQSKLVGATCCVNVAGKHLCQAA